VLRHPLRHPVGAEEGVVGDVPDGWTIAGAAIVVASGLYTWHHDRRAI